MTKKKRSRSLVVVISIIFVLLLAEGVLVAFVFVSPSGSKTLSGVVASAYRAWNGTEDEPGIRTDISDAFHRTYEGWITPLWDKPQTPKGSPEFTACVECHKDYAAERKLSVYMNHPLHAQLGVECATCHTENVHPNPPHPQEKVCAECHTEVELKDQCGFCHPPASLPHFYLMGAPRQSVVECDVCHPKNSFGGGVPTAKIHGDFDGADRGTCLSCHPDTTCQRCHGQSHPSNWLAVHGTSAVSLAQTCTNCHTPTWCAGRCHSTTPTNPFAPRPLPTTGIRP